MNKDGWLVVAVIVSAFVASVVVAVMVAGFEAASYRKYCDTPVTTWDALWLDLRIDECQK